MVFWRKDRAFGFNIDSPYLNRGILAVGFDPHIKFWSMTQRQESTRGAEDEAGDDYVKLCRGKLLTCSPLRNLFEENCRRN